MNEIALEAFGIQAIEKVSTKILVGVVVLENVIDDN